MKFVLEINLGNAGMYNSNHVAVALRNAAASMEEFPRHAGDSKRIQDKNGNTVGEWRFEDNENRN